MRTGARAGAPTGADDVAREVGSVVEFKVVVVSDAVVIVIVAVVTESHSLRSYRDLNRARPCGANLIRPISPNFTPRAANR